MGIALLYSTFEATTFTYHSNANAFATTRDGIDRNITAYKYEIHSRRQRMNMILFFRRKKNCRIETHSILAPSTMKSKGIVSLFFHLQIGPTQLLLDYITKASISHSCCFWCNRFKYQIRFWFNRMYLCWVFLSRLR